MPKKPFVVAKTLLINDRNQALVLRRSVWPEKPERSHQADIPGGMVDVGELEINGAAREIKEETGIVINPQDLILGYTKTFYDDLHDQSHTKFFYVSRIDHTPEVIISYEHESYDWTPVPQLLEKYEFTEFYEESIRYLIGHGLI